MFLQNSPQHHDKVGRYHALYAGYAKRFRVTSSSGGVATFVYDKLFDKGLIDHVVTVGESRAGGAHYEYRIISSKDDLVRSSKTRYHPVTLAAALEAIKDLNGRVAISGVGCFIKAIRLAQDKDPVLRKKIVFLVGIICGGVKSKFFTDYLAGRAGASQHNYANPEYREKDPNSTAMNYGFSCIDSPSNTRKMIKMREVGDMWGTGMFKANACDFCDDVTTELADISVGDAWLKPYDQDGLGHNVIVTRTALAEQILREGNESGELLLDRLNLETFLASQQGSFNHRHDGMGTRIALAKRAGDTVPPKRVVDIKLPLYLKLIQRWRRETRLKSLEKWIGSESAKAFDQKMQWTLIKLKLLTKLSHVIRKVKKTRGKNL